MLFGVPPTGNARAYTFSDEPLIRMRNTAILPGKDKLDDMIASIEDGYYLLAPVERPGRFDVGVHVRCNARLRDQERQTRQRHHRHHDLWRRVRHAEDRIDGVGRIELDVRRHVREEDADPGRYGRPVDQVPRASRRRVNGRPRICRAQPRGAAEARLSEGARASGEQRPARAAGGVRAHQSAAHDAQHRTRSARHRRRQAGQPDAEQRDRRRPARCRREPVGSDQRFQSRSRQRHRARRSRSASSRAGRMRPIST